MNSEPFPFSVRRAQIRREKGEARRAWAAAGSQPEQRPRGFDFEAEISAGLARSPYLCCFLLEGSGAGEYGHNWVEVVQDGAEARMRRVAIPDVHRPNSYLPHDVVTDIHGLG